MATTGQTIDPAAAKLGIYEWACRVFGGCADYNEGRILGVLELTPESLEALHRRYDYDEGFRLDVTVFCLEGLPRAISRLGDPSRQSW
jgi:hypothetical protein